MYYLSDQMHASLSQSQSSLTGKSCLWQHPAQTFAAAAAAVGSGWESTSPIQGWKA